MPVGTSNRDMLAEMEGKQKKSFLEKKRAVFGIELALIDIERGSLAQNVLVVSRH